MQWPNLKPEVNLENALISNNMLILIQARILN
ncbi:hypothetical protein F993_00346 [Acinetobacter proteolyticus]|uniref:Uncharacterized protein n=1 Tax=Acinetobacter proteolyticus TaxID=1776741 RepID=A0ABN0JIE1_9GAMM|nr:hypothetical protein F993_00346 [Acinetobacter proteolyticus]